MDWTTLAELPHRNVLYTEKLNIYQVDDFEDVRQAKEALAPYNGVYRELDVATKEYEFKKPENEAEVEPVVYDYIMGNPPFVGYAYQSQKQKSDLKVVCPECGKNIDYVVGWYYKAAGVIAGKATKAAFVSTNSITQGEQVAAVWKNLILDKGIQIDFAYRTFRWDSESEQKAHVHCVIIGFSDSQLVGDRQKMIYEGEQEFKVARINPYLLDAPDVFIERSTEPICDVPPFVRGCQPTDDGNFILTAEEKDDLLKREPQAEQFIRPFMMGKDFLDRRPRYCIWLAGADPSELRKCPSVMNRVENVRKFRLKSAKAATRAKADMPTLFDEIREPLTDYIAFPTVSSEKRRYVPIDFLPQIIIPGNKIYFMQDASLYHLGVITSIVHMAWMRASCGRLEMRYNYSNTIVYNNYPWPFAEMRNIASLQNRIEQTAQLILDARDLYPNASLADLYDENVMPIELRKAHEANDKAVMQAYGFDPKLSESEIVAELFKMYRKLTEKQ
jgi:hypothetical protein